MKTNLLRFGFIALIACFVLACTKKVLPVRQQYVLIRHVNLIDGLGNPAKPDLDILILNDRIQKIGKEVEAPAHTKLLDGKGLTVLPGIIDSHVHISSVPGSEFRKDAPQLYERLQRHHLKAYLACGVTTILDTGIPTDEARKITGWLANGQVGPRLLLLAPAFTAPKGYISNPTLGKLFFKPVSSPSDVIDQFNETADLKASGIKVLLESGFGMGRLPLLSEEVRKTIVTEAKARHLPLYVHSTLEKDQLLALDMDPYVLVHGASIESKAVIARLQQKPVYLMSTLSIQDGFTIEFYRERLNDPFYKTAVPNIELQTAFAPPAWQNLWVNFAKMVLTDTATEQEIVNMTKPRTASDGAVKAWMSNIRNLKAAGIPIVMGSDSGNWPVMPQCFHGPTSIREIELLTLSGLTPLEAIRASTSLPARMLDIAQEVGSVEEGKIADLVLVEGSPQNDIKALKSIKWTVKNGVVKTPTQWLK